LHTDPISQFPVGAFESLNPAFIRFSSGTTRVSKGVILSHESLLERILAANQGLDLCAGDRVLWTLPMAHHFAVTIILYLYNGVTTVLETSHEPEAIFRAAKVNRTNLLYGSPFHIARLAQCAEAGPLPYLRMAISTASALNADVAAAFEKRFGIPVTQALGIIEMGLPLLNRRHAHDMPTALGQPLPGYDVMVSADGELLLRGPGMFDAYLSPWQPRELVMRDGSVTGRVVKVYDGDTITVLDSNYTQHKIRLDGIDAPERGQDYGAKATQALKAVLGSGQVVVEVTTKDKYGRSIGQVMAEQTNVNAWMVEKGWAWHYKHYSSDRWLAELELMARAAKVGLWADPRPPMAPWDYRAAQRGKNRPEQAAWVADGQFWLNTSSGVRHNQSCRNYGTTSKGRACTKDEGKACGICGS
jgi:endonuclease YncB( thermonuclease family)